MASKLELSLLAERVVTHRDRDAFAAIYDEVAPIVYGVAKRVVRDAAMSEEVTQEVFLEVWSSIERFDPQRASLSTWIVTIGRRRAVDRVRREQSQRNRTAAAAARSTPEPVGVADAVVDASEAERVRRAVRSLPTEQREVIELAFMEGQTHGAIADRLDVPLGTVKGRIRGGLRRLRGEVGGNDD